MSHMSDESDQASITFNGVIPYFFHRKRRTSLLFDWEKVWGGINHSAPRSAMPM